MAYLTADDSPTNTCLNVSSSYTVNIDKKQICRRRITSREFSNSHFPPSFSCAYEFLASTDSSDYSSAKTIISLDLYVLM